MWIKIEISTVIPEQVEITVLYTHDDPLLLSCIELVLQEITRHCPMAPIKIDQSSPEQVIATRTTGKRGGPIGTPKPQQLEIVQGWLAMQGRMNQEVYAQSHGIAASTLRRWLRDFRVEGKL